MSVDLIVEKNQVILEFSLKFQHDVCMKMSPLDTKFNMAIFSIKCIKVSHGHKVLTLGVIWWGFNVEYSKVKSFHVTDTNMHTERPKIDAPRKSFMGGGLKLEDPLKQEIILLSFGSRLSKFDCMCEIKPTLVELWRAVLVILVIIRY